MLLVYKELAGRLYFLHCDFEMFVDKISKFCPKVTNNWVLWSPEQ